MNRKPSIYTILSYSHEYRRERQGSDQPLEYIDFDEMSDSISAPVESVDVFFGPCGWMAVLRRTHLSRRAGLLGVVVSVAFFPLLAQNITTSANEFQSLLQQGFGLHEHADYQHSLPVLTNAWKLRPHDYFVNLLLGMDLLRTGKVEDAIRPFGRSVSTTPDGGHPLRLHG